MHLAEVLEVESRRNDSSVQRLAGTRHNTGQHLMLLLLMMMLMVMMMMMMVMLMVMMGEK